MPPGVRCRVTVGSIAIVQPQLDDPGTTCWLVPEATVRRPLMHEARREELSLGTAFISERWNVKEALLTGAACAVTERW